MRKPDLAAAIAEHADLTKEKAGEVLNVLLDQITLSVAKKESVTLVGFGTFEARSRAKRMGKNPQTGAPIEIPASNTVAFKPGKALKDSCNS
ncbi:HU family DNA-binding protein [Reinekea marinisedimentorum]|uniref:DNA-binding protein HU-alpha n=1 Tax=Reinekea marinisedimentorum TaxID=230495 RepID=A0A4R3HWY9_9GAMM|nr:HU family DNA-binding protein [Reinekea marinisedimentorum]TCS35919.1 DNA-binding protein HU-alpha [Reinekea marinisedimentorum]